jgi:hypothetical protein
MKKFKRGMAPALCGWREMLQAAWHGTGQLPEEMAFGGFSHLDN